MRPDNNDSPEPNLDFAVGLFCGVCVTVAVAAAAVAMVWAVM
jgi:hypothetical protein